VRVAQLEVKRGIAYDECVRCIVSRQSTYIEEVDEDEQPPVRVQVSSESFLRPAPAIGYLPHLGPLSLDEDGREPSPPPLRTRDEEGRYVGFNGRPNKIVDTCYSYWNLGVLAVSEATFASSRKLTKPRSSIDWI
jgi:hypothetical protein